jgi:hypothetical protein
VLLEPEPKGAVSFGGVIAGVTHTHNMLILTKQKKFSRYGTESLTLSRYLKQI